ncbi:hypothetical protein [Microvirga sp. 2TAF3]
MPVNVGFKRRFRRFQKISEIFFEVVVVGQPPLPRAGSQAESALII